MRNRPSSRALLAGIDCGDLGLPLPRKNIFFYGVGHVLNDITAACWFTYLLIFLTDINFTSSEAAIVMLSGQLADGIATVFVGGLIDSYGHYKLWHIAGSILVAISFTSVFGGCWMCSILGTYSSLANTIIYSVFAAVFNIGWAATQVSHMALVNCLSSHPRSRVALTSCRNAFTMVANLLLYAIALVVFAAFPASGSSDVETQYRCIAWVSVVTGWLFVLVFCIGVKEPRLEHLLCPMDCPKMSCLSWFRKLLFYQVAFVYLLMRLTTNVSQSILAFYIIDDLYMKDSAKAVVPAAIYVCSFVVSIILQEIKAWTGRKIKFFFSLGACLWIVSGVYVAFLTSSTQNWVYPLAIIIGVANALMTVTAVSMEGILVGLDISGAGFVYGFLSFLDKFCCGVALFVIESFNSGLQACKPGTLGCSLSTIRMTLAIVPAACALLGMCITMLMDLNTSQNILDEEKPLLTSDVNDPSVYEWVNSDCNIKNTSAHVAAWRRWFNRILGKWRNRRQNDVVPSLQ